MYVVHGKMHFGKAGRLIRDQSISSRRSNNHSSSSQRELEKKLSEEKQKSLEDLTMENIILRLNIDNDNPDILEEKQDTSFDDVYHLISEIKNVDQKNDKLHKVLDYAFGIFFRNHKIDLILKLFDLKITQEYIKNSNTVKNLNVLKEFEKMLAKMSPYQVQKIFEIIIKETYKTPSAVAKDFFGKYSGERNAIHDLIPLFVRKTDGSLLADLLNILLEMPDGYRKYALIGKTLGLEKCGIFHPMGIPDCFPPHTAKGDKLLIMRNLYRIDILPDSFEELEKPIYSGTVNGVYFFREYIHFEGWHHKWNFNFNDKYYAYPQLHDRLDLVNMLVMPSIKAYNTSLIEPDPKYNMHEFHDALIDLLKKDYIADISLENKRHPLWKALRVNSVSLVDRLIYFYTDEIENNIALRREIYNKVKDKDIRKKLFHTSFKTRIDLFSVFRQNPKKSHEENLLLEEKSFSI